ncbi:FAD-dependent oxidoreductase [Streptomyces scabiei]|uniref:FAD-dependent oxidoreductase n=1 Tax=Streptomyces scabiei TaxID=1930 RepID=UPI0004E6896F|nr:FAD-dependent monooxygenase [Streptomyces scabiei]KFG05942.1 monooxygenase [Streptomyces scabiei]MDX2837102.1 FAD-dependent monooxygenase [Streptomyces scabiei]MDX3681691.1 FAD-dependent monooxygenase [Streptomyces scabiei]
MTTALIIGGGIGGLTTALALRRAGIEPLVHEAYDRPDDYVGLFLNTASNGLDAFRAIGVDLTRHVDGVPIPRMVLSSGAGRRLGEVANGTRLPDGSVSVCVRRGELQRALRAQVREAGIPLTHGKRLDTYRTLPTGVVARFTDGTEAAGDLLVGADGIHSRTRALLDPDAPAPRFTGLLSVGGYSEGTGLAPTTGIQHLVFGKRAFFGYLVRESGETYWFANLHRPDEPDRRDLAAMTADQWRRRLTGVFADDTPVIGQILDHLVGEVGAYPVYDIPTSPVWHRGPAALIGDAVHATSPSAGQGASMAVEDAVVLAQCLRDAPDTTTAFTTYERLRRPRVEKVVAYSRTLSDSKTAGPVARVLRDLMMPLALRYFANPEAHAWMYDHHIDWDRPAAVR